MLPRIEKELNFRCARSEGSFLEANPSELSRSKVYRSSSRNERDDKP